MLPITTKHAGGRWQRVNDMCGEKVKVFKWVKHAEGHFVKVFDYTGTFLAWGVDYEELKYGVGTYPIAIVKLEDGSIKTPAARMVVFENGINKG
ncbi:MAG: hypothetical protein GY941_12105 [Planctomycetes bacterium]|nr:hypothetical protein [Planctomycetota bacterium]